MTLAEIAAELRVIADEHPFVVDPENLQPPDMRHKRRFEFDGYHLVVVFTRTTLHTRQIYQLSIASEEMDIGDVPETVVLRIKTTFLPMSSEFPSPTGISRQFVQLL